MAWKQYEYACDVCGEVWDDIVHEEDKDTLCCPKCGAIAIRLPSSPLIMMSREQRNASLKKRSDDDNKKHMNDRVAEALEKADKKKGRTGGVFSHKVQAAASARKKGK